MAGFVYALTGEFLKREKRSTLYSRKATTKKFPVTRLTHNLAIGGRGGVSLIMIPWFKRSKVWSSGH